MNLYRCRFLADTVLACSREPIYARTYMLKVLELMLDEVDIVIDVAEFLPC